MRAQRYGNSSMEVDAPVSSQNFISDLKNLAEGLKQFEKPKSNFHTSPHAYSAPSAATVSSAGSPAYNTFAGASVSPQLASSHSSAANHLSGFSAHHSPQAQAPLSVPASSSLNSLSTASTAPMQTPWQTPGQTPSFGVENPSTPAQPTMTQTMATHASPPLHFQGHIANPQTFSHTTQATAASPAGTQPTSPQQSGNHSGAGHHSATSALVLNERTQQMIHEVKIQLNLSSNAETINMLVALGHKQLKGLFSN